MKLQSVFALMIALLAGCASRMLPEQYALNPSGGKGVVVTSIARSGTLGLYSINIRSADDEVRERLVVGQLSIVPIPQRYDITEGDFRGDVFSLELPAGTYAVERWSVDSYSAHLGGPTPIRFTIEPGQITYLGRFEFLQTDTHGVIVMGATVTLKDQSEKDMAIVSARTPSLKNAPITTNVATSKAAQELGATKTKREYVAPFVFTPPAK